MSHSSGILDPTQEHPPPLTRSPKGETSGTKASPKETAENQPLQHPSQLPPPASTCNRTTTTRALSTLHSHSPETPGFRSYRTFPSSKGYMPIHRCALTTHRHRALPRATDHGPGSPIEDWATPIKSSNGKGRRVSVAG